MSLWQFSACVDGFNRSNSSDDDDPDAMSPAEFDTLLDCNREFLGEAH